MDIDTGDFKRLDDMNVSLPAAAIDELRGMDTTTGTIFTG